MILVQSTLVITFSVIPASQGSKKPEFTKGDIIRCIVMDTIAMDTLYRITVETVGTVGSSSNDSSCHTTQNDLPSSV